MKIISWNVNGLRAVYKRNFLEWLKETKADFYCLQEIKICDDQIPPELKEIKGYYLFTNCAQKKGYSGVAVYTKMKPLKVENKIGFKRFDEEGRFLRLEYSDFVLIALYMPQGGRDKANLGYKLELYEYFLKYIKKIKDKKVILIGDFNIAHTEIDLARPKNNQKNIMFTQEERVMIGKILDLGFIDTFRIFYKDNGHYTWWPYMANARERNIGWRIDYVFVSGNLTAKVKKAFILDKVKGSDHCPLGMEVN